MNLSNEPLQHSPRAYRLLIFFQVAVASFLELQSRTPQGPSPAEGDELKHRNLEGINVITRNVCIGMLAGSTTPDAAVHNLDLAIEMGHVWAKGHPKRAVLVQMLHDLRGVIAGACGMAPVQSVSGRINDTPGLLERFQRICDGSTPADFLNLSAEQKVLYEQHRTDSGKR